MVVLFVERSRASPDLYHRHPREGNPERSGAPEIQQASPVGVVEPDHDEPAGSEDPALAVVEAVRANTVVLLRRLPEEAWLRVGRDTGSGRYSADDWLATYAEHLEIHASQIDANVAAWRARPRGTT